MTSLRVTLAIAITLLGTLLWRSGPAAELDDLAQATVEALDGPLTRAFDRPLRGEVRYRDQQSVAQLIGINYSFQPGELEPDWVTKTTRALTGLGAINRTSSPDEVRGEQVVLAGRKAISAQFTAARQALQVMVIYLGQ